MSDLTNYPIIRVYSDTFTPVRDTEARLLGVIPKVEDDNATLVTGTDGSLFELRISTQVCVCVDPATQDVRKLPGFMAVDLENEDLALPVAGGDDPDLAMPV